MVFPELLAGVFAGNTLKDYKWLSDTFSRCDYAEMPTLLSTGVLILKLGQVIDVLVHDDPEIVRLVVRRYVAGGECFRHGVQDYRVSVGRRRGRNRLRWIGKGPLV